MLLYWPLRAPPQIAGESTVLALTTGYATATIPNRTGGTPASNFIVTWEGAASLQVRVKGSLGFWLHEYGQPFLLCRRGSAEPIDFLIVTGTGTLHLTAVEEY